LVLGQVKRSHRALLWLDHRRERDWSLGHRRLRVAASDARYCAPTSLDWPAQNGNPAGTWWIGAGLRSPCCVHMRQSEWVGGREGNADTSAGVPGKEKSRHTHPPCSFGGAFRAGSLAGKSRHPVVSLPRERATAVVLGYRGMDLPKVLRLAHTQEKPRPGAGRGSEWPKV
jgi:hypothetical protein